MIYPVDFANKIINGDCFDVMPMIPDKAVDMILADLPYGTTKCHWDSVLPMDEPWKQYLRIIKDNGAIVLTAKQPFSSFLVTSQPSLFRYELIWQKTTANGSMNANKMPMQSHENVLVFYKKLPTYHPQMTAGEPYCRENKDKYAKRKENDVYGTFNDNKNMVNNGTRYPKSVITFAIEKFKHRHHPTQKPVALFEWLIRTFTNEGDLVLDNVAGGGTTAVACQNTARNFICIEKNLEYFERATARIGDKKLNYSNMLE